MGIDRLLNRSARKMVVWAGTAIPVDAKAAFEARDLIVGQRTYEQLTSGSYLAGVGAVIFTQTDASADALKMLLETHVPRLLNYGCTVIARIVSDPIVEASFRSAMYRAHLPFGNLVVGTAPGTSDINQSTGGDAPLPHVRFYGAAVPWHTIANFIVSYPTDDGPDENVVIVSSSEFSEEQLLLLRRTFANYAEVHLTKLDSGRSGAKIFRANARKNGINGGWAQPHFVKIGLRPAITTEYFNYDECVDPYIPFHLSPNIQKERCCLGSKFGLLLGDYVDGSESLEACAKDNRAGQAIACLFDRTLRGWYKRATLDERTLSSMKEDFKLKWDFPKGRFETAQEIGAKHDLNTLETHLQQYTSKRWLRGPTHGDLHATNVRVRATDAIVIDFQAYSDGLVLRDIARLEVSLLVDGFRRSTYENPTDKNQFDGKGWLKDVEQLYLCDPTVNYPIHYEDPSSPAHWFHLCVRQIRLHARPFELEPRQYAAALAMELLLKSARDNAPPFENYRRAAAYFLVERMISVVFPLPVAPKST